jgi:hypothetical protein
VLAILMPLTLTPSSAMSTFKSRPASPRRELTGLRPLPNGRSFGPPRSPGRRHAHAIRVDRRALISIVIVNNGVGANMTTFSASIAFFLRFLPRPAGGRALRWRPASGCTPALQGGQRSTRAIAGAISSLSRTVSAPSFIRALVEAAKRSGDVRSVIFYLLPGSSPAVEETFQVYDILLPFEPS